MSIRRNNTGKPSSSFKNNEGRKPKDSFKKSSRPDSNSKFSGKDKPFKKPRFSDDANELAPPRFLPPRDGNQSFGRKGPDSRNGKPSGRGYGGDRNDSKFKSDGRKSYKPREEGSSDGYRKPSYPRNNEEGGSRPPFKKREGGFGDSGYKKPSYPRNSDEGNGRAPFKKREDASREGGFKRGGFKQESRDNGGFSDYKKRGDKEDSYKKSGFDRSDRPSFKKRDFDDKDKKSAPQSNYRRNADDHGPKRPFKSESDEQKPYRPKYDPQVKVKKSYSERKKELLGTTDSPDDIRLNKYIANSGVCSRREADDVIKQGLVSVNGTVIEEMGYRVKKGDVVKYDGRKILPEPFVYILMNKPKDFITTTDDEKGRKTVVDLLADKIPQRVYPIGRLDRNTTGVLLLTNDGDVAQALTHPSFQIKKVYHAVLDKKVSGTDLDKLVEGVELEDGVVHADAVAFVDNEDKRHVGVEIHSGKNRVVRRMFEALGYDVEKLDRVSMGIFTKKDLPRGKWRFLKESEIGFLMKLKSKMP